MGDIEITTSEPLFNINDHKPDSAGTGKITDLNSSNCYIKTCPVTLNNAGTLLIRFLTLVQDRNTNNNYTYLDNISIIKSH